MAAQIELNVLDGSNPQTQALVSDARAQALVADFLQWAPPAAACLPLVAAGDIDYLGLAFDPRSLDQIVEICLTMPQHRCVTLVTPNVDHLVRLHSTTADALLWAAYHDATLRLCDSRVVARLARLSGLVLPVIPGSDLTVRLFERLEPGDNIVIVGGDPQTLADLSTKYPNLLISQHIPPMGMLHNPAEMAAAAAFVVAAQPRFVFLAVGSPQQELLAMSIRADPRARGLVLCIGASIQFLTGRSKRAPLWMQRGGIEWLHRLLSNPSRMWRRYLIEGPRIFALAWNHRRSSMAATVNAPKLLVR